jgi:glycosyltransferase involved in cell wall biosynthesis
MIANSVAVATAWNTGGTARRLDGLSGTEGKVSNRLTVVPNGVDLDRFKPLERTGWIHQLLGIPRTARLIGMPAVFARWKGHELVIDAFRSIANAFPDAHLVFAGGSIYDTVAEREFGKQLEKMISGQRPGIRGQGSAPGLASVTSDPESRIHALPFQPKIESMYPELDIVVHYSLRPEPFGRVILEAMACGIPVLAADEGGPVEILGARPALPDAPPTAFRPSIGGWLVTPRNAAGLAMALRHALSLSPEDRKKIGQLGRVRAEDHFSARAFARAVAQVLFSLS